jgi:AcrR family transcriptional regulator
MRVAPLAQTEAQRRSPLTRRRVLEAAVDLADRHGIEAVSMRRLGQELGVEAMSLYTHVKSKDDLLDGMVDVVIGQIPIRRVRGDWKKSLRRTIMAARQVLLRHPWAPAIIETRISAGPAVPTYFNGIIRTLREGGFSLALTHHTLHLMGSRLLGFTQDLFDDSSNTDPEATKAFAAQVGDTLPYVAEMALAATHEGGLGGCDTDAEFEFALDFMLDGLERLRDTV